MKKFLAMTVLGCMLFSQTYAFSCQKKPEIKESVDNNGNISMKLEQPVEIPCEKKLPVCEETLGACNKKVQELDAYGKQLRNRLEATEKQLEDVNKYADVLEEELEKNDPNSFWNRNKMLIGFIGGVLLTTGVVIGTAVVVK